MHALAGQRVQVNGQGGHQGLAFTGLHLGDAGAVQHDTTDDLHREVLHAQHTPAGLTADGEGLGQDIVQSFAVCQPLLQRGGHGLQFRVGLGGHFALQRNHLVGDGADLFQLLIGEGTEELV